MEPEAAEVTLLPARAALELEEGSNEARVRVEQVLVWALVRAAQVRAEAAAPEARARVGARVLGALPGAGAEQSRGSG